MICTSLNPKTSWWHSNAFATKVHNLFANKTFVAFYFTFLTMKPLGNLKIGIPILFQIFCLNEANKNIIL